MTPHDSPDSEKAPALEPQPLAGSEESVEPRKKQRYDIHLYRDWCKSCGICAALCPKQVLSRDEQGSPHVIDPDACIGCGWCELHCPDFAISVRPRPAAPAPEADE